MMKRWKSLAVLGISLSFCACTHNVETGQPVLMPGPQGQTKVGETDDVENLVKGKLPDLNSCYKEERERNPKAFGKAMFSFSILKDGRTDEVRLLASTLKSAMMEGCLVGKIESWKFSPPRDGQVLKVRYPFSFQP